MSVQDRRAAFDDADIRHVFPSPWFGVNTGGEATRPVAAATEVPAMDDGSIDVKRAARDAAYSMPLADINPADPELFRTDTWAP